MEVYIDDFLLMLKKKNYIEVILKNDINLPEYFNQNNCNILINKSGILILKDMFESLIRHTHILNDYSVFYFFDSIDSTEVRYYVNYSKSIEINSEIDKVVIK